MNPLRRALARVLWRLSVRHNPNDVLCHYFQARWCDPSERCPICDPD